MDHDWNNAQHNKMREAAERRRQKLQKSKEAKKGPKAVLPNQIADFSLYSISPYQADVEDVRNLKVEINNVSFWSNLSHFNGDGEKPKKYFMYNRISTVKSAIKHQMDNSNRAMDIFRDLETFTKLTHSKFIIRALRLDEIDNYVQVFFFADELLEIIPLALQERNAWSEKAKQDHAVLKQLWLREESHHCKIVPKSEFEKVIKDFGIDKSLITIIRDPVHDHTTHQTLHKSLAPIYSLSPNGKEVMTREQAYFYVFQSVICGINWNTEKCRENEQALASFQAIYLFEITEKFIVDDQTILIVKEFVDQKIELLKSHRIFTENIVHQTTDYLLNDYKFENEIPLKMHKNIWEDLGFPDFHSYFFDIRDIEVWWARSFYIFHSIQSFHYEDMEGRQVILVEELCRKTPRHVRHSKLSTMYVEIQNALRNGKQPAKNLNGCAPFACNIPPTRDNRPSRPMFRLELCPDTGRRLIKVVPEPDLPDGAQEIFLNLDITQRYEKIKMNIEEKKIEAALAQAGAKDDVDKEILKLKEAEERGKEQNEPSDEINSERKELKPDEPKLLEAQQTGAIAEEPKKQELSNDNTLFATNCTSDRSEPNPKKPEKENLEQKEQQDETNAEPSEPQALEMKNEEPPNDASNGQSSSCYKPTEESLEKSPAPSEPQPNRAHRPILKAVRSKPSMGSNTETTRRDLNKRCRYCKEYKKSVKKFGELIKLTSQESEKSHLESMAAVENIKHLNDERLESVRQRAEGLMENVMAAREANEKLCIEMRSLMKINEEQAKELVKLNEEQDKELVKLKEEQSKELVRLKEEQANELGRLKEEQSKELMKLKKEQSKELVKLKEEQPRELAKLKDKMTKATATIENMKGENKNLRQQNEKWKAEVESKNQELLNAQEEVSQLDQKVEDVQLNLALNQSQMDKEAEENLEMIAELQHKVHELTVSSAPSTSSGANSPMTTIEEWLKFKDDFVEKKLVDEAKCETQRLKDLTTDPKIMELCVFELTQFEISANIYIDVINLNISKLQKGYAPSELLSLPGLPILSKKFRLEYLKEMREQSKQAAAQAQAAAAAPQVVPETGFDPKVECYICTRKFQRGDKVWTCNQCTVPTCIGCHLKWKKAQKESLNVNEACGYCRIILEEEQNKKKRR